LARRVISINHQLVELTPKEYAVLSKLAASPNRVITQTQLLKEIWGNNHTSDTHYLRIVISHLRQKIGDSPSEPTYIRTESGVGYRLNIADKS
ncbi:winged helix-turn-helix domain-containing protein, partial [Vibrio paracholerae]